MHRSLLVILVLTSSVAAADPPPNILLILADDVGCETLGCYGGRSYRTPHLDRLAASGLKFRHCYSMPVCHRRYPRHLGHPRWGSFPKSEEERSLGTAMKQAGFATAIAGKWQLGLLSKDFEQPNRMGFDEYCLFGWHEGPRYYQPLLFQNGKQRTDVGDRFGPDVYCEFLIDFMTRHRDRRFFAFYSMALCHDVTDDLDKPVPFGPKGRYDSYREMIEAMDARVGRMVKALEDLGLRQKTLVLFTTDNGTSKRSYETVRDGKLIRRPVRSLVGNREIPGGKGNLSDDGTHVPLLASRPGSIRPKSVSDRLVDMSDFLPTLETLRQRPAVRRGERPGREDRRGTRRRSGG